MSIVRWQPFTEIMSLRQAMDKLLEDSFVAPYQFSAIPGAGLAVPINMYQTDREVVVKAALAGVKPEEIDVTITGDTLTIKGETKSDEEVKRENYLYKEHRYGAFHRSVTIPDGLKADKAEAVFDQGVLTLTIPKSEKTKPKSVKIKAKKATKASKESKEK
jgi:HSP20 family protein